MGSFSQESLSICKQLLLSSSEVNANFSEAFEIFNFTRCERPNGSAYGTDGVCRKGTEAEKEEEPKQMKTPKVSSGAAATGAGTAHELTLVSALGGDIGEVGRQKLRENLERGGENAKTAAELAKKNAEDLKNDLKQRGMTQITEVIWTAQLRGDSLAQAAGVKGLSEKNNQSDILIKGKDKDGKDLVVGVSLKAATSGGTKYPNDIPFFNGGFAKEASRLGADSAVEKAKTSIKSAFDELGIKAKTANEAKTEIRSNPELKAKADAKGKEVLKTARNDMITAMQSLSTEQMRSILSTMTGAPTGEGQNLSTLKLTGYAAGSKSTKIEDAVKGKVPTAIASAARFEFEPAGDNGIRVIANGVPVMKVRMKWESQPLASSLKISGEAP